MRPIVTALLVLVSGCSGSVGGYDAAHVGGDPSDVDTGTDNEGAPDDSAPNGDGDTAGGEPDIRINATLSAIAVNTALDLGPYTCAQPSDNPGGCGAITDYSRFNYDPIGHQLLMFGGGHAGAYGDEVEVFDFATLGWSAAYSATLCSAMTPANFDGATASWIDAHAPLARHVWDNMVVANVGSRRTLMIMTTGGLTPETCHEGPAQTFPELHARISWYDIEAKTWTFGQTDPGAHWYYATASENDPVSGLVLNFGGDGPHFYDPVLDMVEDLAIDPSSSFNGDHLGYSNNLIYFPPNDRFYYITRGHPVGVFELAVNRVTRSVVVRELTTPNPPEGEETGWAYDSENQVIGGGITNNTFFAYDPIANTWDAQTMQITSSASEVPNNVVFHALDYDPVDGVFLFLSEPHRRTWAYRYR